MAKTLYEKIYAAHLVLDNANTTPLIYIDRHFIHEVTSPQAFAGLKQHNRTVRCPEKTFATMDHNTSTQTKELTACSPMARTQLETLQKNCQHYGISLYDLHHPKQGIVHIIGPEQGLTLPGMTIVCGDSHTSTHGAFGALAFGIGTSEVEHVFATQTLKQQRAKTMLIKLIGQRPPQISAKDIILAVIGQIGHAGGNGFVVEFAGEVVQALTMEERMTLCNMSIEMGAKSGLIAPDATTINYLRHREFTPRGENWKAALQYWQTLYSDPQAKFDKTITINIQQLAPQVTWGTNPAQVIAIDETIPYPTDFATTSEQLSATNALHYMGLEGGQSLQDIAIDKVFIGSCTNARIEDLRQAAAMIQDKKVASNVQALVVPGSEPVKLQAEAEGLDKIFITAGFEWRIPGCSMCLGMNDDILQPYERCASTSNRNFEGRQGRLGRTHLVSPAMAAAAAIHGHFIDIRKGAQHKGKEHE